MKTNDLIMDHAKELKERVGLALSIEECIIVTADMFEKGYTDGYKEGYDDSASENFHALKVRLDKVQKLSSKQTSDLILANTQLTIIKDEIIGTKKRATVFLNGPLEIDVERFYQGQITLIKRIEDSIDTEL